MTGKVISHYHVMQALGSGGMGIVYRAQDLKLKRPVALKFLSRELTSNAEAKQRFVQEAQAAAALNHPNICTIYEIEESEENFFIAMEFIEGHSLREQLNQGALSLAQALAIAIQIAEGLQAAHAKGIVHRDLTSSNVMLSSTQRVKITDFGLAQLFGSSLLTQRGTVMGTVAYMSPEQARGKKVDPRTDLWALGVLLYEMLTGSLPFRGDHPQVVIYSIINETPEAVLARRPDTPPALEQIITKLLTKNPDERYQTADEVLADLQPLAQAQQAGIASTHRLAATPRRFTKRMLLAGVAGAFLALAGAGLYFFRPAASVIDSVAVLPFANLSNDPETEYLSEGLTESLIYSLSRLSHVKVRSRSATLRYEGRAVDAETVGKELGVKAVLTGTVLQRGNQLAISAELVDTRDQSVIWGEQYNLPMADLLALQQKITSEITGKMRLRLSPSEQMQLQKPHTTNSEAYRLYLLGQHYASQYTRAGLDRGIAYFEQAIGLDSSYALAYFGLAYYYVGITDWFAPAQEAMPKAKAAAERAIQLDESLAEAHAWLAVVHFWYEWNQAAAQREFQRALELNPNNALTRSYYGAFLVATGHLAAGIAEAEQARQLDPLSPETNSFLGVCLYAARRYEEALAPLRTTIDLAPTYWFARMYLARTYQKLGRWEEAMAEIQTSAQMDSVSEIAGMVARAHALAGNHRAARRLLQEMLAWPQDRFLAPPDVIKVCLALGDTSMALDWVEKAYAARSFMLIGMKVDPEYDPLRNQPRFQAVLHQMGLD